MFLLFYFIFLLIIELCYLTPAALLQIFVPIADLIIPIGIPNKETKAEIEIHPVIVEAKIVLHLFNITYSCTNLSVLFTHKLILLYFYKEIVSYFFYIFQYKFLTYIFEVIYIFN